MKRRKRFVLGGSLAVLVFAATLLACQPLPEICPPGTTTVESTTTTESETTTATAEDPPEDPEESITTTEDTPLCIPLPTVTTTTAPTTTTTVPAPADAPDVLFVQLDDASIDSLPFYMRKIIALVQGPHWYRFTQAVTPTTLCGPKRMGDLTGQTVDHHLYTCHVSGVMCPSWIANKSKTITVSLDNRGYYVGWYGKQLNSAYECDGDLKKDGGGLYPNPPGVDDARILGPGDKYTLFNSYSLVENGVKRDYRANQDPAQYGTYVTADFVDACIATCPSDQPLALFWNPMAPHQPGTPAPDFDPSKVVPGLPQFQPPSQEGCSGAVDPSIADKPYLLQTQTKCNGSNWKRSKFQESLQAVDNRLPAMIDAFLARNPERPKRIVITSDHGHELGNHRHLGKEVPYEMSLRVPLFIYDSDAPGGTVDTLVNTLAINPTIHEWAGSTPLLPGDASSLVPLYMGNASSWPDHTYASHLRVQNEMYSVRPWRATRDDCSLNRDQDGDGNNDCLKLVKYPASSAVLPDGSTINLPDEWELYDLIEDPWELTNLLPNSFTGYPGQPGWNLSTPLVAAKVTQLEAHITAGA